MKIIIISIIWSAMLLFIAAKTNTPAAERSTQQVVLIHNNPQTIKTLADTYYKLGYRVTAMTGQSLSNHYVGTGHLPRYEANRGDIILIMEK